MSAAVELGEGGCGGVHGGLKLTGFCVSWEIDETPHDVVGVRAAAIDIFRARLSTVIFGRMALDMFGWDREGN